MIARYSLPEMSSLWSERSKYNAWLKVELAVCAELATPSGGSLIPMADWRKLKRAASAYLARGGVDPKRVEFHEAKTRHDVIAFTTAVAESLGPISRYIHFGLTSSDIVDTALSLTLQEAGEILKRDVKALLAVLKSRANELAALPTIGRSHGMFAEPTSFGLKFLGWYTEWKRNAERLERALEGMRFGKLSGAVGVNAHWAPELESRVLARLGLEREPVATQVIPRDRHAEFFNAVALMGASLERIAVELRHLQRSEVAEVREAFKKGQKGSSAMPHKQNPISSENLTGCARLLRAYAGAALENVALWHERDISHSSVERVAFPDATLLLDYALNRMVRVLEGLVVDRAQVAAHLKRAGSISFSGHLLLALVKRGVTREDAYAWVQECALDAKAQLARGDSGGSGGSSEDPFLANLKKHPKITAALGKGKLPELMAMKHQLRNVKKIYRAAR